MEQLSGSDLRTIVVEVMWMEQLMNITTLNQVLADARRLSPRERAQLVAQLVSELAEPTARYASSDDLALIIPIITEGQWSDAIPTNREDLYDADERC